MKHILFFLLLIPLVLSLLTCENEEKEKHNAALFDNFKKKYNKIYKDSYEEKIRYENFKKNLDKYKIIKKKYPNTLFSKKSKINYYSDLSPNDIPWGLFRY